MPAVWLARPIVTPHDLELLACLGLVFTGAAQLLFLRGLRGVSARLASIISSGMEVIYGLILAALILHEIPPRAHFNRRRDYSERHDLRDEFAARQRGAGCGGVNGEIQFDDFALLRKRTTLIGTKLIGNKLLVVGVNIIKTRDFAFRINSVNTDLIAVNNRELIAT